MKSKLPWLFAGAGILALALVVFQPWRRAVAAHPDPRPGVTAERVLPPAMIENTPGALAAYEAARRVPQILDGLYCHCNCSKFEGHRSLLTCFESNHGARCDICMGEAMLAEKLAAENNSLQQIRSAIDAQFGS